MNPNTFYIISQEVDEEPCYWSNGYNRFVSMKRLATEFGEEILTLPPPEGATGVIEETPEGFPCNFYGVPSLPQGSIIMREIIKGPKGETRGYIAEFGNRQYLSDASGRNMGWYDKTQNKTYNRQGAYVGSGNQLAFLLED